MATSNQAGSTDAANAPGTSRVLVVDDNPQNQELLAAYLETMDVEVRRADDGVTALQQVSADPPDLILLDIMMPRMSGFEVCTKLKSDPGTRDIPVIMVTALDRMADIQRAVECGTDDFLSRPLSRLELVTRVRNLLKVRHLKNELDRTLEYLSEIEKRPTAS
ncbi:MAG: response regulator [Planctomycetota bacterium]